MSGTIVLGIGNRLGGDDAAGALVADVLNQKGWRTEVLAAAQVTAINGGTAPESYTSVIRRHRPDLLILVDAADMGLPSGAVRIIAPENISVLSFSTHSMPLSMFVSYVQEFCGKVLVIGVQPERTETGRRISRAVQRSARQLAELILEGRLAEIPPLEQKS
jgi:hydrogenase 3 maturation protease